MRQATIQLIHLKQARAALRRTEAAGTLSDAEAIRLAQITDQLIDGLVEEVVALSRELVAVKASARRPY